MVRMQLSGEGEEFINREWLGYGEDAAGIPMTETLMVSGLSAAPGSRSVELCETLWNP